MCSVAFEFWVDSLSHAQMWRWWWKWHANTLNRIRIRVDILQDKLVNTVCARVYERVRVCVYVCITSVREYVMCVSPKAIPNPNMNYVCVYEILLLNIFAHRAVFTIDMLAQSNESGRETEREREHHDEMDRIEKFEISANPILILYTEIVSTIKSSPRTSYIIQSLIRTMYTHTHTLSRATPSLYEKLPMAASRRLFHMNSVSSQRRQWQRKQAHARIIYSISRTMPSYRQCCRHRLRLSFSIHFENVF